MRSGGYESQFTERHQLTRSQEVIKAVRFLCFEISAGVVQVIVFTLLNEGFRLRYWMSYLPALIASVLWSFTANRKFTFKSVSNVPVAMMKVTIYYLIFTPASTWWGGWLESMDFGVPRSLQSYAILIGTMIVNFITEFLVYRLWVYRNSINTSASGLREQQKYELRYNG